jgi:hypothetical protein
MDTRKVFERNEVRSRVSFRRAELKSYKVSIHSHGIYGHKPAALTTPPPSFPGFLPIILQISGSKLENDLLQIYYIQARS